MNEGDLVFVNYGEVPMCIHTRLLGAHIQDDIWVVITPDKDIYEEELHTRNPDLVAVVHGGGGFGSPVPAGVSRRHLYSFAPMSAQDYQNLMQAARTYAAQLRVHLGLPPPGLVVPPPVPAPGGPPPPAVNDDPEVWISLEQDHGHVIGEVIIAAGLPLPPGHVSLGPNKALLPMGANQALAVKKVLQSQIMSMEAKDLRVMPLCFDPQGNRRIDFSAAVVKMSQSEMPGGGLQLDGPPSTLHVLKSMVARGLTPVTDHEHWLRTHEIPRGDRSIYEMEVITRSLEAFAMVDQINLPNSKGIELLMRRWQLIREAHRLSPGAPDYSAADVFMGWEYRRGDGVHPELAKFVAGELKDQAQIAKEARKAKEEMANKRKGGGRGGGATADKQ